MGHEPRERQLAAEVLRAVADGALSRALVDALVSCVLHRPDVLAALAARDADDRFVARRAIELAAIVIEGFGDEERAAPGPALDVRTGGDA